MELINEFRVAVPVAEAWRILTDVERIAPCMPGADLQEVEGEEYRGIVKVKVGPIAAQYKGKASFIERDEQTHCAVLRAEGRDTRGQGNASATITAELSPDGDGTQVRVTTDLTVTGKVAQFGRGVMADVSTKLLNQFVDCLEGDVLSGAPTPAAEGGQVPAQEWVTTAPTPPPATAQPTVRKVESTPSEPVDLLGTAGGPVMKRAAPLLAILFALHWMTGHRRRKALLRRTHS